MECNPYAPNIIPTDKPSQSGLCWMDADLFRNIAATRLERSISQHRTNVRIVPEAAVKTTSVSGRREHLLGPHSADFLNLPSRGFWPRGSGAHQSPCPGRCDPRIDDAGRRLNSRPGCALRRSARFAPKPVSVRISAPSSASTFEPCCIDPGAGP